MTELYSVFLMDRAGNVAPTATAHCPETDSLQHVIALCQRRYSRFVIKDSDGDTVHTQATDAGASHIPVTVQLTHDDAALLAVALGKVMTQKAAIIRAIQGSKQRRGEEQRKALADHMETLDAITKLAVALKRARGE